MKNVILIQFLFLVLTSSRNLYGQHYQIRDVQQLRAVGFNIGEPVRIGTFEDQPFYRALVEGKEKKQLWRNTSGDSEGKPGRCVKGVGCCCRGKIEYLENGRIISAYLKMVEPDEDVSDPPPVHMFYDPNQEEFWILPLN